ncbi:hypothetical protein BDQ17DRAFT_1428114 [Cyathus striatus]|nr:hypothetical protein BDQ17DRAFT_1428114 [Cyathus striatus]
MVTTDEIPAGTNRPPSRSPQSATNETWLRNNKAIPRGQLYPPPSRWNPILYFPPPVLFNFELSRLATSASCTIQNTFPSPSSPASPCSPHPTSSSSTVVPSIHFDILVLTYSSSPASSCSSFRSTNAIFFLSSVASVSYKLALLPKIS